MPPAASLHHLPAFGQQQPTDTKPMAHSGVPYSSADAQHAAASGASGSATPLGPLSWPPSGTATPAGRTRSPGGVGVSLFAAATAAASDPALLGTGWCPTPNLAGLQVTWSIESLKSCCLPVLEVLNLCR